MVPVCVPVVVGVGVIVAMVVSVSMGVVVAVIMGMRVAVIVIVVVRVCGRLHAFRDGEFGDLLRIQDFAEEQHHGRTGQREQRYQPNQVEEIHGFTT